MNGYSELLRYIREISQEHVSTITQGDIIDVDLDKKNIYPLLHVDIGNASFTSGSVIQFDVQLACFDIRDTNKEINTDKFYGNDNEIDNLNETMAILNRIWQLMLRDFEDNNITASENPSLLKSSGTEKNVLDGWVMSFQVEVPNININLCQ